MTKQMFKKILDGGTLDAKDMSAESKKVLYDAMVKHGMSQSTAYLRFFDKGFRPWEILGVTKLKQKFLLTTVIPSDKDENVDDEGSRGYAYVLSLRPDYDDSQFHSLVTELKLGTKLCEFMAEHGMASQMTTRTRFKADDWKLWEIMGVQAILEEICKKED